MLNPNNGLPPVVISDENSKPKTSTYCSESTDLCRESFLEGTKYHSCDSCDKQFTRKDSLEMHKKTVHLKLKPAGERHYSCDVCDKQFLKSGHLFGDTY